MNISLNNYSVNIENNNAVVKHLMQNHNLHAGYVDNNGSYTLFIQAENLKPPVGWYAISNNIAFKKSYDNFEEMDEDYERYITELYNQA